MLLVFFKEELGVVEAGPEHPFVAVLHRFQMVVVAVANRQEQVHELAVLVAHGEIPLMILHRRDDRRFRQLQVIFVKFAAQGRRIFDEENDFFQQIVVHDDRAAFFISQLLQSR